MKPASMDSTRRNEEFRKALLWNQHGDVTRARRLAAARWPWRAIDAGIQAKLARRFSHYFAGETYGR